MLLDSAKYVPLLSLKPAEMAAIEELPEKDKDLLLPLFSIKRWANSNTLAKSNERITKAFGTRKWIADIDKEAIVNAKSKLINKPDALIFQELIQLADPKNGYHNWVQYIENHSSLIPTVQLDDVNQLNLQLDQLIALGRMIVVRFQMSGEFAITKENLNSSVMTMMSKTYPVGLYIVLDYGDLDRRNLIEYQQYTRLITQLNSLFPQAAFSVSGTSFPYSFSGSYKGEIPIYERQIFNKVKNECLNINLIYSDRASTRAVSMKGGAGTPPPRIDFPLKNDWRFVRKEFDDPSKEKEALYQEAAIEVMNSEYWDSDLPPLWGTQMIEKTKLGDLYGITSANRATAVRINLHLYQQLHYHADLSTVDTEEDWID